MRRRFSFALAFLLALVLLVLALLLSVTHWLPRLAGIWLPAGTRIALDASPRWRQGALYIPALRYLAGDCLLAEVDELTLRYGHSRWQADAQRLALDSACLSQLPDNDASPAAPRTLAQWQALLPSADVTVKQLMVNPYQSWAGALRLTLDRTAQRLDYQGENLRVQADLQGQHLSLRQLTLQAPGLTQPVTLHGALELTEFANGVPETGRLEGDFTLAQAPHPLHVALDWRQQAGSLTVTSPDEATPLVDLPWQVSAEQIRITAGRWRWPWATQPLAGGVALTFTNWRQGLEATGIGGRMNMLTQGRGGKGNVVLTLGPGRLSLSDSDLPLRLTGESKLAALQFYASLPGTLSGSLLDPQLRIAPGALLRMRGRLLSTLEVDEARWPLAGVTISSSGVNGRLQAILRAHDASRGRFMLHLDGRAHDFWPDSGRWDWRYWGNGYLAPLAAKWDGQGTGGWQQNIITLDTLSTGFDKLRYGKTTVAQPRLYLTQPLVWRRGVGDGDGAVGGALTLEARETRFDNGGYLPSPALRLTLKGGDPAHFLFNGELRARDIGPVRVNGRWDGERLRGQAWWPRQSLTVFQPLLSPDLKMKITDGTLRAQVAFSASDQQGFAAGGHWVVEDGAIWMPDNSIRGIDFSLPFRLRDSRWRLGTHGPVSLRIKTINSQFPMTSVSADLQGSWPWSEREPLTLSDVSMGLLGGSLSMPQLRLPQHQPAIIRLREISLSELITALKPKQIALSGRINGELPLWLNDSPWLVKEGWIANDGALTLRLDKQMADAIASNNIAAGAALDWLRYMEISRSWATINLNAIGDLTMQAQVNGTSRFSNRDQHVNLTYRHQENLFQLWRSLRFGDNLQSWVEQNATLPTKKDTHHEN
ncbi:YdbH family protein [Mixta calida]|uniref:YdbH family protein n=1 Tax=Mixta calida TaxID=665913 RepID=UPI003F68D219